MNTLYEKNGLVFWTEQEIKNRRMVEDYFVRSLSEALKKENRAFEFVQVEAPILTPLEFINVNYTAEDMYITSDNLALRPETTMGSYVAAYELLNNYNERKFKLPIVVWQHGKSFRREQDQPSKFMRLKEFYQLEFQIMYHPTTANDYSLSVIPAVANMISFFNKEVRIEDSDRLPDYSEWTKDIICVKSNMEVCSISKRKDNKLANVLEVAIGTDRILYNM